MNSDRKIDKPNLDRDELAEVITDNADYFLELHREWRGTTDVSATRELTRKMHDLIGSQIQWNSKAKETGIPYEQRREWIGQFPEVLSWIDLALKALEFNPEKQDLGSSDLIAAWHFIEVESKSGRNVAIESLWFLTYIASVFTEGCGPKQLTVHQIGAGWKAEMLSYGDVWLIYRGRTGISASVDAPLEIVEILSARRNDWIEAVRRFGDLFTGISRRLIFAANSDPR